MRMPALWWLARDEAKRLDGQNVLRRALPLLKLGTELLGKIPTARDTWPEKLAKVLALLDATNKVYGGGRSKMRELSDRYALVERESETFVRIFFATTLRDLFTIRRQTLDEKEDLLEAVGADGERLFFRETHYGGARIESDFYATPGIDFSSVIDRLWGQYPDGIYLSVTTEPGGWRKDTTICEVPPVPVDRLSRKARDRLAVVMATHAHFIHDGVHRCYLCYGPPGTGKSTFAVLFARAAGGRALKLDAASLPLLSVKELGFLLDALRPGFLVIDDLDRAPVAEVGARVLFMLERLKTHYPAMTVVLTANDPRKLDAAMLRCGRIDIPLLFDAPEPDETEQMVRALLVHHDVPSARSTAEVIKQIVDGSDHLTHAYLDDLCRRLRHEDVPDVLASVMLLKRLAEEATAEGPKPLGSGQPAGNAPS